MRVVSAGDGYRYLLKSVAAGDGGRDLSTPLTRYYTASGAPPGWWLGSGLAGLGSGDPRADSRLGVGDEVTEDELRRLLGEGGDPITGEALGRAYPNYKPTPDGARRRAVAGFDYTFSVPKSVSVLWALADGATQVRIVQAHHAAVAHVVALMEREVAATRTGAATVEGAVAQVAVHGLVAAAFDHYDSRSGDPQLHTHVVVSNKVQTVHDGKWRALDGRPVHAATVALSEHYRAVLADHLTRILGVDWEQRSRGRDRNLGWDIAGIPGELLEEFSSRSRDIEAETARLIADYRHRHGRQPSATAIIKLRAQATLATRPDKQVRSLSELTVGWRRRAESVLGSDAAQWVHGLLDRARTASAGESPPGTATPTATGTLVHVGQVTPEDVMVVAKRTLAVVGEKRSTWRRWNLYAEASRQTMHLRFATAADREQVVGAVVDAALDGSVRLTPDEAASSPVEFLRADGTSVFRPRHAAVFTSAELLAAEDRLVDLARSTTGPSIDGAVVDRKLHRTTIRHAGQESRRLGADQCAAIAAVAGSGRGLDVLVGPAGTGKTTTLRVLRDVWEAQYGAGSVLGLAPSAAAADVLAHELSIDTENTAKWLYEHQRGRWVFQPDQLVIVDEASLAGTVTLDALASHATAVGAKVLLVGDPHQVDAVDAGGAFSLLVDDRCQTADGVPELSDVRRFHHSWEVDASLRLREGDVGVLDAYLGHDRIRDGDVDAMAESAYLAWRHDVDAGRSSLLVAETRETVTELNTRARTDRIAAGHVLPHRAVPLADGTQASAGDIVVTRRNDRRLHAGRSWVRNGDRWTITDTRPDGAVRVRRVGSGGRLGASVVLPGDYAAQHLELGYAATVHRAQGATVDTTHVLVASPLMTREAFYVAMTRGRAANTAYVATDRPDLELHQRQPDEPVTARSVLSSILHHSGTEASAHQTGQVERERYGSVAQLAAEYDTIANTAQKTRWTRLLADAGLNNEQVRAVVDSGAYGALAALLRRAEADGHNLQRLVPRIMARHRLDNVDDTAAVLQHRIQAATARPPASQSTHRAGRIAGLVAEAVGTMHNDMRKALSERRRLIENRAMMVLQAAIEDRQPWVRSLGTPPADPQHRRTWLHEARTVAAYRDRHQITGNSALGDGPMSQTQQTDSNRARMALHRAHALSDSGASRFGLGGRTRPELPGTSRRL